jgi:Lrp/AsnC family leucine-responsive transcriptional regulator
MLDEIDQRLVEALAQDARTSLKDLALRTGLSAPSVSERLRRLEDRGIVRAFTIEVDPRALGYGLQAIVRIRPLPGMLHIVQQLLQDIPEITECDKVTGDDCFVARLCFRTMDQLDEILDQLAEKAQTNTAIIKSTPVKRRLPPLR